MTQLQHSIQLDSLDRSKPVTFQCSQCGECCSSIMIHIEREKWETFKNQEWFQARLTMFNKTVTPWNDTHVLLPHKPDKTCVFLDDDKRCIIEAQAGKNLKPAECRHFPFAALQLDTGQRLYDCSAACKHVAEELLTQYKPIMPEGEWAKTLPAQKAPRRVRISLFKSLSWEEYQARQSVLPGIFQQAMSAEIAIRQAWQQIRLGLLSNKSIAPRPVWWQQLILLIFLRKPYGNYSMVQLLQGEKYQDPYVFGTGELPGVAILNRDMAFSDEAEALLKAFAFNILNRFVLFSHGHWASGLFVIASVAIVLARWHARVLASVDSRIHVSHHDMANAIRLTERYYTGHQPRFLAFFRDFIPLKASLLKGF